jgi:uncharacterized phage-associated protein
MHTATQIADWIVRFRAEAAAPVDPMSLQKLLFYAQAFHLARQGEPLFSEKFKAWRDGPVVPQVWHRYNRDNSTLVILPADDNDVLLGDELEASISDTVEFFSLANPFKLSKATHSEDPWIEARGDCAPHEASGAPIPTDKIRVYYAGLLWDGEEALSRQEILDEIPEPRVGSFYCAGICIRGMRRHPFYSPAWAKNLSRPVSEVELPKDLLAPIKRRNFIRAGEL